MPYIKYDSISIRMTRAVRLGESHVRKHGPPSDGSMFHLFGEDDKIGWRYQASVVTDRRYQRGTYVSLCVFTPQREGNPWMFHQTISAKKRKYKSREEARKHA